MNRRQCRGPGSNGHSTLFRSSVTTSGTCPRFIGLPFADMSRSFRVRAMKGVILAGGAGSRLFPLTLVASKQLQPVYDKPMVYYPLTTLVAGGIRDLCLISTPHDLPRFRQLLGDGTTWGISIDYREQPEPAGIAQAFLIAESFIGQDAVTLILGDNIFFGGDSFPRAFAEFNGGATIFGYQVNDPHRYGVVEFDARGCALSIEEKPRAPKSNFAVPGVYLYDNQVVGIAKKLKGIKIGCPEEAAFRRGFLSIEQFEALIQRIPPCEYRDYLNNVLAEARRPR